MKDVALCSQQDQHVRVRQPNPRGESHTIEPAWHPDIGEHEVDVRFAQNALSDLGIFRIQDPVALLLQVHHSGDSQQELIFHNENGTLTYVLSPTSLCTTG